MELVVWLIVFVLSFAVLIKAADLFTKYSERVGLALGISQFVVGITVVSIGTSLPELATSFVAIFQNNTEIVIGNVVGSNIANIFLVGGVAATIAGRLMVRRSLVDLDAPLLAGVTMLFIFMMLDWKITPIEAAILIASYVIYVLYSYFSRQDGKEEKTQREKFKTWHVLVIVISAVLIYLGAKYAIDSVIKISEIIGISSSIIALSVVAIGTSLPEGIVSIIAAKKGNHEMALGNIFGSCIFNIGIVIGLPGLFGDLAVSESIFFIGLPFIIAATLLFVISGISRKVHIWEGAIYLLIYAVFIGKLFGLI